MKIIVEQLIFFQDLCVEFHMPIPEYIVLDETGLPHSKQFTVQCKISSLVRTATSNTKKQAKQMAAGLLVKYFNEHMASRIAEFADRPVSYVQLFLMLCYERLIHFKLVDILILTLSSVLSHLILQRLSPYVDVV